MSVHGISRSLSRLTLGVYIVGVEADGRRNVMTAAWVTQVSGSPPSVVVAVGQSHYTAELIDKAGAFSLSVLTPDHRGIALRCGSVSGRVEDKLEDIDVRISQTTGAPIVDGCAAYLDCTVTGRFRVEDHLLFIGQVVGGRDFGRPALAYKAGEFFG